MKVGNLSLQKYSYEAEMVSMAIKHAGFPDGHSQSYLPTFKFQKEGQMRENV